MTFSVKSEWPPENKTVLVQMAADKSEDKEQQQNQQG
jgi:hypothetical protein